MKSIQLATALTLLCSLNASAQAPLPGATDSAAGSLPGQPPFAPVAGIAPPSVNPVSSPLPGNPVALNSRRLPINYHAAALRLEELRNLMPNIRPKDFQEMINEYLEWVGDLADGHWRIAQSFSKVESMKDRAETEKQTTFKIGQLKRQAMLLKAEFLIGQNRQTEALQPLVEIVVAEPKTATGESAYSLLKQIGFSEESVPLPISAAPPRPVEAVVPSAPPQTGAVGKAVPKGQQQKTSSR